MYTYDIDKYFIGVTLAVLFSAVLYRQAAASPAVPRFLANLAMVPLPSCGRGAVATEKLMRANEKETTAGTDLERKRAAEARALVRLPPAP